MVEGVGPRVVHDQFQHLLELLCCFGKDGDLPSFQFLKEWGLDSVGEFVGHCG